MREINSNNAARMLRFLLTDGQQQYKAIEFSHTPLLTLDVAPGTKMVFSNVPTRDGYPCCHTHKWGEEGWEEKGGNEGKEGEREWKNNRVKQGQDSEP